MKNKTELAIEIQKLADKVDCTTCPESRCCCIFKNNYKLSLSMHTAQVAFGKEQIVKLQEQNRIVKKEGRYLIQNGPCPLLDKNNRCTRHSEREKLGLNECIKFPICIEIDEHDNLPKIFLDYRCYYMEKNWLKIREDALQLKKRYNIDIVVVYRKNKYVYDQPLSKFDKFYENI